MNLPFAESIGGAAEMFQTLLPLLGETSGSSFFIWDITSERFYVSPVILETYAFPSRPSVDAERQWMELVHPADRKEVEKVYAQLKAGELERFDMDYRLMNRAGQSVWVNVRVAVRREGAGGITAMVGGITQFGALHRADHLTGLLNQVQFEADFSERVFRREYGYLLLLGIDDMKLVNDRYGRAVGDELIRRLAATLQELAGTGGRVYRLEGDHFAVKMTGKNRIAAARFYVAAKEGLARACQQVQPDMTCSVSAGAIAFPQDADEFMQLWQYAESALDEAKGMGKNTIAFFNKKHYDEYLDRLSLREDLRRCVNGGMQGFSLQYQPQTNAQNGRVQGAEALLRWTGESQGRVSPDVFIPILENHGMICEVGRWVLDQALWQCALWRQRVPDFRMSVNLSFIQLEQDNIAGFVLDCLRRRQLPGDAVLLEITESARLHNYDSYNKTLSDLNRIGVAVAIDDFGTGYSSLGYLKELHINEIKIDRSFVTRIRDSEYDHMLIQFIIRLAHSIGVKVCVEGMELDEELHALLPMQPDLLQGFLFGRPLPPDEFERWFMEGWDARGKKLAGEMRAILEGHGQARELDMVSTQDLTRILDEMDETVVVTSLEDHRVLWINRAGCDLLQLESGYENLPCHALLRGRDAPCEGCHMELLSTERFLSLEFDGAPAKGHLPAQAKKVHWKGGLAHMLVFAGRAEAKPSRRSSHRARRDAALVTCARALGGQAGGTDTLDLVLAEVGRYHQSDNAYIFELDADKQQFVLAYEWCHPSVAPRLGTMQPLPAGKGRRWVEDLRRKKSLVVAGPQDLHKKYPDEYEAVTRTGLSRLLAVPFFVGDTLTGFMGVDSPRYGQTDTALMEALAYFVSGEIEKRRMEKQLLLLNYVDPLTGVYNRNRYLADLAGITPEEQYSLGLVFVDVLNLQQVNHLQGHEVGDGMMRQLAADLRGCFAAGRVYRVGGDEMVVLCRDIEEQTLLGCLTALLRLGQKRSYAISTGHAWAGQSIDITELARQADERLDSSRGEYLENGSLYREWRQSQPRA